MAASEEKLFRLALRAAKSSAAILKKSYATNARVIGEKGSDSTYELVTTADLASEKAAFRILKKASIPIISEETLATTEIPGKGFCFVVDPLDGTVNYSMRLPFFCVSIGLLKDRAPVAGVIINPATGEVFSALKGKGAFLNGKRIRVSGNTDLAKTLINHCHKQKGEQIARLAKVYERMKKAGRDFRRLGSGELDLAWVACGRNDAFFALGYGGLWDVVAGAAIVREAGGVVTDLTGKDWTIDNDDVAAANNLEILGKLLDILKDA